MTKFREPTTEIIVDEATLSWMTSLSFDVLHDPGIAVGVRAPKRADSTYLYVPLDVRLPEALVRLDADLHVDPRPTLDGTCYNRPPWHVQQLR